MYNRGSDFLDLVVDEHLTFDGTTDREIAFGALKGFLDVRYGVILPVLTGFSNRIHATIFSF
jgi:hypothetical protein